MGGIETSVYCYVVIESWQGYVKENFAVLSGLAATYDECKKWLKSRLYSP